MKVLKRIEERINEKMTPNMIEAIRISDKDYIMERFNLLELLIILRWKNTGKLERFGIWN